MKTFFLSSLLFFSGCCISLETCEAQVKKENEVPMLTRKQLGELVKCLDHSLKRYYVFPENAAAMGAAIEFNYQKGKYNAITTPNELADTIKSDLDKINPDPHLQIWYDPKEAKRIAAAKQEDHTAPPVHKDSTSMQVNFDFFYDLRILPGSMGYLRFDGFVGEIDQLIPTFNSAFQFLKNCRVLFIDMRYNGGGEPELVAQIESYFFKEKTRMNDIVDRMSNTTTRYYADPLKSNNIILAMPVYILTSRNTGSAAEDFCYGMQTVKRATIVGETTWGGAHPTDDFVLNNGFIASIPFARSLNHITNTDWEGTGVVPNITTSVDEALLVAQDLAFKTVIAQEVNETEKKKLNWQWNYSKALSGRNKSVVPNIQQYAGDYGSLEFFIKEGQLLCRNHEFGNQVLSPQFIEDDLFQLDKNIQIRFEKDHAGKIFRAVLYWKDGEVSFKEK